MLVRRLSNGHLDKFDRGNNSAGNAARHGNDLRGHYPDTRPTGLGNRHASHHGHELYDCKLEHCPNDSRHENYDANEHGNRGGTLGTTAHFADGIFQEVYLRRAGKPHGRYQRHQRFGQRGFYRRSVRFRLLLLEHLLDVLLQPEIDGGGGCGLVRLRNYHRVYLSAGYRLPEEFNCRQQQRGGHCPTDF